MHKQSLYRMDQSPYHKDSRPRAAPRTYQSHRVRREEPTVAEYSSSEGEDNGSHDDPVYDHRQRNQGSQHLGEYIFNEKVQKKKI